MHREDQFAPHLIVSDGFAALEFYKNTFGAEIGDNMKATDGKRLKQSPRKWSPTL